jgi:hypothetical protein
VKEHKNYFISPWKKCSKNNQHLRRVRPRTTRKRENSKYKNKMLKYIYMLGEQDAKQEDNIKKYLQEVTYDPLKWTKLDEDKAQRR